MLFNSIDFAVFLPIVFAIYWLVGNYSYKGQNIIIVVSSYVFYGWWDWRFLSLIFLSTLLDYFVGLRMSSTENLKRRKLLLWSSIVFNIGMLAYFKYSGFFVESFSNAFTFFGSELSMSTFNIVLPVGISFYTFQTLSYTIDIYKKKLEPTNDFIAFSAFVSFFPQLVAGPIERASNLLPQFMEARKFQYHYAVDGLRQMLWGFFKKMVIADNCAVAVNDIFQNHEHQSGGTLAIGAFLFSFQIYCDFSGYSDIAIGTSRLFSLKLSKNFDFPYFSRDVAEFWRRWHISLTTWFRDYIYIPLGGNAKNHLIKVRNVIIVFVLSGLWHGANWTFVIWGIYNALLFLPLIILNKNRIYLENPQGLLFPKMSEVAKMIFTFCLISFSWVFFRSENLGDAFLIIREVFSSSIFTISNFDGKMAAAIAGIFIILMLVLEWRARNDNYALETLGLKWRYPMRYGMYYFLGIVTFLFSGRSQEFIYFQF